jgi:hypothetical protein
MIHTYYIATPSTSASRLPISARGNIATQYLIASHATLPCNPRNHTCSPVDYTTKSQPHARMHAHTHTQQLHHPFNNAFTTQQCTRPFFSAARPLYAPSISVCTRSRRLFQPSLTLAPTNSQTDGAYVGRGGGSVTAANAARL